jgi:hypothetical protein
MSLDADQRSFAHDALNHLHVILGNLELLAEERPDELLLTDARDAAAELSGLLRQTLGR